MSWEGCGPYVPLSPGNVSPNPHPPSASRGLHTTPGHNGSCLLGNLLMSLPHPPPEVKEPCQSALPSGLTLCSVPAQGALGAKPESCLGLAAHLGAARLCPPLRQACPGSPNRGVWGGLSAESHWEGAGQARHHPPSPMLIPTEGEDAACPFFGGCPSPQSSPGSLMAVPSLSPAGSRLSSSEHAGGLAQGVQLTSASLK